MRKEVLSALWEILFLVMIGVGVILVSGGAVNPALIRAKKKWMRNCNYRFETESSLKGAAMLGQKYLAGMRE
jgi:hypothetical protein